MSPSQRALIVCILVAAVCAHAISCHTSGFRRSSRSSRYGDDYDNEETGVSDLRGGGSSERYSEPSPEEWQKMCAEANCEPLEECRHVTDFRYNTTTNIDPDSKILFWQAVCYCEACEINRSDEDSRYASAVCATNGETFYDYCFLRRCRCLANRPDLEIAHEGQCDCSVQGGTKIPSDLCLGDPKGWKGTAWAA